jgi:hypothetical protein
METLPGYGNWRTPTGFAGPAGGATRLRAPMDLRSRAPSGAIQEPGRMGSAHVM